MTAYNVLPGKRTLYIPAACLILINIVVVLEWTNDFAQSRRIYWQLRNATGLSGARPISRSVLQLSEAKGSSTPTKPTIATMKYNCTNVREVPKIENILCKETPKLLPDYKNPCIREKSTSPLRCLPYFHIFGVCKTGTTDLFSRIVHHPQVLKNKGILSKETWFWSWRRYAKMTFERYMTFFPSEEIEKNVVYGTNGRPYHNLVTAKMTFERYMTFFPSEKIEKNVVYGTDGKPYHNLVTGSGDPMDFWDFSRWKMIAQNDPNASEPEVTTPYLIRHMIPDIKLIVLLRDPVERTYSHYLHADFGNTLESFHQHVVDTTTHLTRCERAGKLRACVYEREHRMKIKAPMQASLYYLHLTEWFKVFPRQQILILTNEDMRNDTIGVLRQVFRHLKLGKIYDVMSDPLPPRDMFRVASLPKKYATKKKKLLGPMFPKTKEILTNYFKDSIYKLVSLLQDDKYLKWLNT